MIIKVNVKWNKQKFDNIELDLSEPPIVFKSQLYALTGVAPDRQKIMGVKGGLLKDDANWEAVGVKEGHNFMLMGSAEEIPKAPEKAVVFLEDLSTDQALELAAKFPPGLSNFGNTCYMNATLQCFRVVPELNRVLRAYGGGLAEQDNAVNLTAALRDLYVQMDTSNKAAIPIVFLSVLRKAYPQFAQQTEGHFSQQDAEECWSQLLTTLSQKLPRLPGASGAIGTGHQSAISDLFGGELESSMKCSEGGDDPIESRSESFTKLVCHIGNQTAFLIQGLKEGLEESMSKRSQSLGRDATFVKSSKISRLPHYLTIQFMRFFWRADKNVKAKIVKPVEFPFILDVFDLCTPALQEQLKPARKLLDEAQEKHIERERKNKRKAAEDSSDSQEASKMEIEPTPKPAVQLQESGPSTTGKYELSAVLTHKGRTADSGHYIAWVKQAENEWLKFDDDKVSPATNDDIKKLDGHGGGDWHIAYLCLYRPYQVPAFD